MPLPRRRCQTMRAVAPARGAAMRLPRRRRQTMTAVSARGTLLVGRRRCSSSLSGRRSSQQTPQSCRSRRVVASARSPGAAMGRRPRCLPRRRHCSTRCSGLRRHRSSRSARETGPSPRLPWMATCCERRSWTCCSWVTRSERGPENAALCRFGERVRFRRALLGEGVTRQQLDVCLFERMAHTERHISTRIVPVRYDTAPARLPAPTQGARDRRASDNTLLPREL